MACRSDQREAGNLGGIEADFSGGAPDHLHRADILAHFRERDAVQQELQLQRHRVRGQAQGLEPILVQREMECRHAGAPIRVDRAHHWTGVHDGLHLRGDRAKLVRVRSHDAIRHRERRGRSEHDLGDPHLCLGGQSLRHGIAQPELEGFPLLVVAREHDDLGERGIGQFRRHGQEEARRALADVGRHDPGLLLPGQPRLDLHGRGTGLFDRSAVWHLHFDQHLRPVGGREELLLHRPHADDGQRERCNDRSGDQPLASDHPAQHLSEAVVARGVVDGLLSTLDLLDIGQHLHAQVGREGHGHHPGCNQGDADDPEHVAGVFASRGAREPVRHEADGRDQRAGKHGSRRVAPGIGRGLDAAVPLLQLHDHHFDGDDGVVHQQAQRQDERAERDTVEVLAGGRHDDEHGGQRQGHGRRDNDADVPAHANEADDHHDEQGDEELDHELVDRRANVDGLVGHFREAHSQRQRRVDLRDFRVERFAEIESVPVVAHHDAQQQCRFAVAADHEGGGVLIAALDGCHVRKLQRPSLRDDRGLPDLVQVVECAIDAKQDLRPLRLDGSGGRQDVLAAERGEDVLRRDAKRGQAVVREGHEDAFWLLADDVDLLHARDMQQLLAQPLCVAHQHALRLALGLEGVQRERDVRVFVVDDGADDAVGQFLRFVRQLLAGLVELFLHFCRRCLVEQGHHREGQAGTREGLRAVVPPQFLHALFQRFRDLVLHLLRRRPGPGRDNRHLLDRERRVFSAPQLQERQNAGGGNQEDQEQRDGSLAYGECRQVESALAHGRTPCTAAAAVVMPT